MTAAERPHDPSRREPLVAIVTPVYNGERFLAETMACVQAQTYPRLVHVVLDNASTDGTVEIVRRCSGGRVPVLGYRNHATVPAANNWNAALSRVPPEAEWFRLLCADDLMAPEAVARKVELALRHPSIGVVGCYWPAEGLCGSDLPTGQSVFEGRDILRRYLLRDTMVLSGMFTLLRCDLARACAPLYDPTILGFDTDANLQLLQHCDYGLVHEELVTWRRHGGSISRSLDDTDLVNKAEWLLLLDRYGPGVLTPAEYRSARLAFRRHYLRKLLQLRLAGRRDRFRRHWDALKRRNDPAGLIDVLDAVWDWVRLAARGRRDRVGRAVLDS